MPELPEVETIRRQLVPHVEGRTITGAEVLDPRWTMPEAPHTVERELRGAVVERLHRSGKYLVWELSGDRHLLTHLRMTGALLFDPDPQPAHARVRLQLDSGHLLVLDDPRRFGTGHLVHGATARDAYLHSRIGVEPLTPEFNAAHLFRLTRGRRAPIKAFVLDQRRIAGVGNIYADEALFRARIHPLRPAGRLKRVELERLREGIEAALQAGIDAKGASIDDFRHIDGARGAFQDRFLIHRRAGEPCPRCGGQVIRLVVAGRGTYVCERCQRRPRRVASPTGGAGERAPARAGLLAPTPPPARPAGRRDRRRATR
ncbi:MAG: bifunctional DNA-formamidopyrimidine glycosylase/DNA-(apurinic or apyrimidinic site) lyase [Solirubrobacterales bacterium]|nr:bifunctional DNA-formamidopyrimidine glycosylase/DNA-(apurinic or apyrimidinic site) lyase [Solirubrobacterales bacterium]MBV9533875.1 bifunctional DNA-formamidopyrimidine glycosylase/DNA-(apurinic or apyrimidinic site) lyase [Solirubrobacterales bacterium]